MVPEVQTGIHEAFAGLRSALPKPEPPAARPVPTRGATAKRKPEAVDGPALVQARQSFEQRLFDLEDDDWKALVEARAVPEVEHAVLSVLSRGFLAPVVGARGPRSSGELPHHP